MDETHTRPFMKNWQGHQRASQFVLLVFHIFHIMCETFVAFLSFKLQRMAQFLKKKLKHSLLGPLWSYPISPLNFTYGRHLKSKDGRFMSRKALLRTDLLEMMISCLQLVSIDPCKLCSKSLIWKIINFDSLGKLPRKNQDINCKRLCN